MSAFLLDANLSPKLARFLASKFGFDVASVLALGLGHLPDSEIVVMAKAQGRVIVTLDEDFGEIFFRRERGAIGVVYLKLRDQANVAVEPVLERFFREDAPGIDLDHSLVVVTERRVRVVVP